MRISLLFLSVVISGVLSAQEPYATQLENHRKEYKSKFLKTDRSPLKEPDLKNLKFFEADEDYVVQAVFTATPDAKPFDLPTYSGITKPYVQYGWLDFKLKGADHRLAVYQSLQLRVMPKFKTYLFLPFKDLTNGEATYGGGRYMDLEVSDISDGKITLDFNKAYNPWCAYSDGYNCPIPPSENHLPIEINAGEQLYNHTTEE